MTRSSAAARRGIGLSFGTTPCRTSWRVAGRKGSRQRVYRRRGDGGRRQRFNTGPVAGAVVSRLRELLVFGGPCFRGIAAAVRELSVRVGEGVRRRDVSRCDMRGQLPDTGGLHRGFVVREPAGASQRACSGRVDVRRFVGTGHGAALLAGGSLWFLGNRRYTVVFVLLHVPRASLVRGVRLPRQHAQPDIPAANLGAGLLPLLVSHRTRGPPPDLRARADRRVRGGLPVQKLSLHVRAELPPRRGLRARSLAGGGGCSS